MKCDRSCIYYQIYSGYNPIKDEPVIKIRCDYYDEPIRNIPDELKYECEHYKNKNDTRWRI